MSENFQYAAEGELTLPVGSHRYLFNVNLPHNLPSSFEGQHGYVRYLAEATIDKPWKFDHQTRTAFTVICILDLNAEPFSLRVCDTNIARLLV
jgi:hypothetical protein